MKMIYLKVINNSKNQILVILITLFFIPVILKENISIPDFISDAARLFLIGLLEKNPAKRLGCQQEYCFKQIKSHDFFEFIDWEKVRNIFFNSK